MTRRTTLRLLTVAALLATVSGARAQESTLEVLDVALELDESGVAIHLDNDLFSGAGRDSDYSWGATVTFSSAEANRLVAPVSRIRGRLASRLPAGEGRYSRASGAAQLGIVAMTPEDLLSSDAQPGDRPYASLLFVSSAETRVFEPSKRARFTSFTVGALGLGAAELAQRAVHEVLGGEVPNGWEHQISEGGEPTARFVYAEQWLVGERNDGRADGREVKLTLGGSACTSRRAK